MYYLPNIKTGGFLRDKKYTKIYIHIEKITFRLHFKYPFNKLIKTL